MERVEEFFTVEALSIICGILQIVGLVLIICRVAPVIIGVCGFAAIVKVFLPLPQNRNMLGYSAALAGLGIIILHAI